MKILLNIHFHQFINVKTFLHRVCMPGVCVHVSHRNLLTKTECTLVKLFQSRPLASYIRITNIPFNICLESRPLAKKTYRITNIPCGTAQIATLITLPHTMAIPTLLLA